MAASMYNSCHIWVRWKAAVGWGRGAVEDTVEDHVGNACDGALWCATVLAPAAETVLPL